MGGAAQGARLLLFVRARFLLPLGGLIETGAIGGRGSHLLLRIRLRARARRQGDARLLIVGGSETRRPDRRTDNPMKLGIIQFTSLAQDLTAQVEFAKVRFDFVSLAAKRSAQVDMVAKGSDAIEALMCDLSVDAVARLVVAREDMAGAR